MTILDKEIGTIVENGEADESIGIDMLVSGYMANEHDFG